MGSLAIVAAPDGVAAERAAVRMLAAAPHRGTRSEIRTLGRTVLGVSNTDATEDAWVFERDGVGAALAGTLDNRAELDEELGRSGIVTRGVSPAETVAASFSRWGDDAPARFRGAFTGAAFDGTTLRVFRDHIGFQPLYYRQDANGFFAGTEAKQVVAGSQIAREPDLEGLEGILFGGAGARKVALRGIERFPAASLAVVDIDRLPTFRMYWDPARVLETSQLTLDETVERLAELLEQAVRRCVTGNDAISLSGGIDSPSVAAFAAPAHMEQSGNPLHAISAVFPDLPSVDEQRYIELVCAHLRLPLRTYVPKARSLDDLGHWVRLLDAPVDTVSVPAYAEFYEQARSVGAGTVLGGELAEYVFTLQQHLLAHLLIHGRWRAFAYRVREEREHGRTWLGLLRPLALSLSPAALATRYARWQRRDWRGVPAWIDAGKVPGIGHRSDLARPVRRRWLDAQVRATGQGDPSPTLEADAICAASYGVRSRHPFADIDLWEFFLSLPAEIKFPTRTPKILVRRAIDGRLPDEIVWRRDKTAFDEHVLRTAEWPDLKRWLLGTEHRIAGIDYDVLRRRLDDEAMDVLELRWARDLARVHAFLEQWA